jgi:hypothetical protein
VNVDGTDPRFVGKPLPVSRFAGDAGEADPSVRDVLQAHAEGRADQRRVQNVLVGARLLIPTAAHLDESEADPRTGMATEKTSHLSVVSFRSNAGWHGLLAFTGIDAVRAWDETARPVPVTAVEAAAAALADGRSVLVIDLAGPARTALSGAMLRALAAGRRAVPVHEDPDVVATRRGTCVPPGEHGGTFCSAARSAGAFVHRSVHHGPPRRCAWRANWSSSSSAPPSWCLLRWGRPSAG